MTLHKIVNVKRIDLTPEEEKEIRKEWAKNEEKKKIQIEENMKLKAEKERVVDKLLSNLTEEEKQLLKSTILKT